MESKLKTLRKKKGYSQKSLALLSNVPLRTIKAYEEGHLTLQKLNVKQYTNYLKH